MEAYYMAPGTLLSALWWPKWEGNPKRRELYVNVWLASLPTCAAETQQCKTTIHQ